MRGIDGQRAAEALAKVQGGDGDAAQLLAKHRLITKARSSRPVRSKSNSTTPILIFGETNVNV